jgi:urease accessory protein
MPPPGHAQPLAPVEAPPAAPARRPQGWAASLELRFQAGPGGTRLVHNRHEGPLRLLKALPSGDGRRLEAVIVHPPGGLVGGDTLSIDLQAGPAARVLATTPGAQKWYRSTVTSSSSTTLALGSRAAVEWLPQPAILYDHARAVQSLAIEMQPDASCLGWEILIRGRGAMGESLTHGHIEQTLSISVARQLLWQERLHADAADRLFRSPLGWDGQRIGASVWCCAPALPRDLLRALRDEWRALLDGQRGGATIAAEGLLLAKLLGDDSEQLMSRSQSLWRAARTALEGSAGSPPRIWRT